MLWDCGGKADYLILALGNEQAWCCLDIWFLWVAYLRESSFMKLAVLIIFLVSMIKTRQK